MEKHVVIEDYTPDWVRRFQEEKNILKGIMSEKAIAIEHIGSTSVEGLGAKPILDIMVGVNHLIEVDEFIEPLEKIGYEFVFHKEFSNRRFFRKGKWRAGTHHLHFYKYESDEWSNNILFRDFLRANSEELIRYHQLKKELAEKYHNDRVAYTKAKEPFIQYIIQKAKEKANK
ncbi:GrpB family protein [Bacillus alkalicellulosilyticus]|uniref:GrpB family protein n=1 Tax=Alkalihalobacterium alkalicellulosilyticum TaxID=1912214 RepID=UPI000995F17C|nr:GrpB family protein [Bacillus alkalicellulosilyticus]